MMPKREYGFMSRGLKISAVVCFIAVCYFNTVILKTKSILSVQKAYATATATAGVTLSASMGDYITLSISSGGSIVFGNLTPGSPICSGTPTVVSVSTNAANGYILELGDGASGTNSALLHTDASTYIPDFENSATVQLPNNGVVWGGGDTGLGVSMFAADSNKETTQWGTGSSVCHASNFYAGIPQNAALAHTVTGAIATPDTSSWSWKIDVPNTQKNGTYSGTVLFTAVAVLS